MYTSVASYVNAVLLYYVLPYLSSFLGYIGYNLYGLIVTCLEIFMINKNLNKTKKTRHNFISTASYILIVAFACLLISQIISIHGQIEVINDENEELTAEISQIQQSNEELQYGIEHSSDPDTVEDIARNKLDLVKQGEIIFYDSNN